VADEGDSLAMFGQRPVATPGHELGFARGVAVRDPDGHTVEIVEP
jgi:catechol 2,3-dioxygenase-like lactoylglutathione lyase family enzyme